MTMSSRTVTVTEPLSARQGRILEEDCCLIAVSSLGFDLEANADEVRDGVEVPDGRGRVLEERLCRARVDAPPQDAARPVPDVGHELEEREAGRRGRVAAVR
jgi:hypothetical protein